MKNTLIVMSVIVALVTTAQMFAQEPAPPVPQFGKGVERIDRPRWPGGKLNDRLGEYLTIEGVRAEQGKVGKRTLIVDTLNGKKLSKPVYIWVHNLELPKGKRCVLKKYESGQMIGTPPAAFAAAKEQGKTFIPQAAGWQWSPHFVVLIVTAPADLDLERSRP